MSDSAPSISLDWPALFAQLFARRDLSYDQAGAALSEILAGRAQPSQIAAFAACLRTKGETVEEICGMLAAMRAQGEIVTVGRETLDTCGTGGDRSGTINVSTIAALVCAGAGVAVCKHGNRAASSRAGSADVLEALGVSIALGPAGVERCIEEAGIGFCFAPRFHPAMRHAAQVRGELGVGTVFNLLGPLANPARARQQVVGVANPGMAETMLGVLESSGALHAMVVYGHDGLDELSSVTTSTVYESYRDESGTPIRRTYDVDPRALGLAPGTSEALRGGDAGHNADRARAILAGERGPQRDLVVLNAAAGLVVAGRVQDLADGIALAEEIIDTQLGTQTLDALIKSSNRAFAEGLG